MNPAPTAPLIIGYSPLHGNEWMGSPFAFAAIKLCEYNKNKVNNGENMIICQNESFWICKMSQSTMWSVPFRRSPSIQRYKVHTVFSGCCPIALWTRFQWPFCNHKPPTLRPRGQMNEICHALPVPPRIQCRSSVFDSGPLSSWYIDRMPCWSPICRGSTAFATVPHATVCWTTHSAVASNRFSPESDWIWPSQFWWHWTSLRSRMVRKWVMK